MRQDYLNAQIKPHFIYNTLNKIRTLAIKRGEDDIAEAILIGMSYLKSKKGILHPLFIIFMKYNFFL